ncbi:nitrogenase iron-molybdenum cofactor biosynthesis protein NifN [Marichromatium sp. AB32]|uniref:nitrogenase iron-molybdenum cofactor biosynthesis protein NifN n=1 Tax=Marichromatium sp. AB32 TaxID=2483363 RepID=UPI000F4088A3|nr:nitrogenase iron-molybdenum cofactor biosynthesis protein NifN [Marichromatium sp. AB32]RNE93630.1 nitrogenase iron-molybdenum cofactor biosynthesis protein NifN [Marichromatium sp. AB32]
MAEVRRKMGKPLQVNPHKLSQPMGATLAFLGVDRCMPLMHGAQGCASFTKVMFTRHFCEPIALQTTAVTDVTAVLDGGDYSITESIKNIGDKVSPALIGVHTTGLTETKGDDLRGVASKIEAPLVYVNTPDYQGGLESGWTLTVQALIEQLTEPCERTDARKVVLVPHVSMQPIEVEKLREFIEAFGFEVVAVPDLSSSLDNHLGEKQASLSGGGVTVAELEGLADAGAVVTVGASVKPVGATLQKKNPAIRHRHFDHVSGLVGTDELVAWLLETSARDTPPAVVERWRKRLQDAMLDSHFAIGQTRFLLVAEPDHLAAMAASLREVGGKVALAIATVDSPVLGAIEADRVIVGDLEDAEQLRDDYDIIIGNFHTEALAHRVGKRAVMRGFPNYEEIGSALKNDVLYEGGAYFLFDIANAAERMRESEVHHARERIKQQGAAA